MNILETIEQEIEKNYQPIWESSDREEAFLLCNQIRKESLDIPEYSPSKFDEGWQYRTIFHPDYETAKEEFFNLVFGWW